LRLSGTLEVRIAGAQELAVREKQELATKEEKTTPGRYYVPAADIFETEDALTVILEMPGVQKNNVNVALENDVLRVDAQIDFSNYKEMEPVYTEYNVVTTREDLRFQTKSIKAKSAHSLMAAC
jgi:HSP20 family protein